MLALPMLTPLPDARTVYHRTQQETIKARIQGQAETVEEEQLADQTEQIVVLGDCIVAAEAITKAMIQDKGVDTQQE